MQYGFDDFSDQNSHGESANKKPFWKLDLNNEDEVKAWLQKEMTFLKNKNSERIEEIKRHVALYKGIQYWSQDTRHALRDREDLTNNKTKQKVVVNHLYDLTEQRVAKIVKYRPNVNILPANDEMEDRYSSKVAKLCYDQITDSENYDEKAMDIARNAYIMGESYLMIDWDQCKGPELKESAMIRQMGSMLTVMNKENEVIDQSGMVKTMTLDKPVHQGDVALRVVPGYRIFIEKKESYDKANYGIFIERVETEKLKDEFPLKAGDIKVDDDTEYFDFDSFEEYKSNRETWVHYFYHKKTRELPEGRLIKFTKNCILESRPLPYSHGDFPWERLVDIQVPGELHGRSFYIHTRHMQAHVNNLTTMFIRNQYMAGHPKWMVPMGSVNLESLGNDLTIVQYRGAQAPLLQQANPTGAETFNARKVMIEEMGQIAAIYGVSRGEPPPGIKAGVALQFLAEQENERQNASIARWNDFNIRVAKKLIATASDFYSVNDQRKVKMLGKSNMFMDEYLDPKHLAKSFDIRVQNSSALPKSQAARTQQIMDLSQAFPGIFSQEQIVEMLDLGKSDRFFNEATAAIRSAEDAFEELTDGKPTEEPQEYENHVAWWNVFSQRIQDPSFRKLMPERKQKILDHLMAREMLMMDKAKKSMGFAKQLDILVNFPLVFEPDLPVPLPGPSPEQMEVENEMMEQAQEATTLPEEIVTQ